MKKIYIQNITLALILIVTIIFYFPYLNLPFDYYDNWLQRITYFKYDYNELPLNLKNSFVSVNLKDYLFNSSKIFGRVPGHFISQFLIYNILDNNPFLIRILNLCIVLLNLILVNEILKEFKVNFLLRTFFLLFCTFILSYNVEFIISSIISVCNLIFFFILWLIFRNVSFKKKEIVFMNLIGFLFFLILIQHEITGIVLFAVLYLIYKVYYDKEIGSLRDLKNLFLNRFSNVIYIYLIIYLILLIFIWFYVKQVGAYGDIEVISIIKFIKLFLIIFFKYLGFNISFYLGIILFFLTIFIFFLTFKKDDLKKNELFSEKIIFSLLILLPTSFLYSLINNRVHESHIIQIFATFIFYESILSVIMSKIKGLSFYLNVLLIVFICGILLFIEGNITWKKLEDNKNYIKTFHNTIDYLSQISDKGNMNILFRNISIIEAYSIVAELFLKYGINNYQFQYMHENSNDITYSGFLVEQFNKNIHSDRNYDLVIEKINNFNDFLKNKGNCFLTNKTISFLDIFIMNIENILLKRIIIKISFGYSLNSYLYDNFERGFLIKSHEF